MRYLKEFFLLCFLKDILRYYVSQFSNIWTEKSLKNGWTYAFCPVLESSPYSFRLASRTVQQWVAQCCVHAWSMLWKTSKQRLPLSVEHYITSKLFSLVYPLLIAAGVVTVLWKQPPRWLGYSHHFIEWWQSNLFKALIWVSGKKMMGTPIVNYRFLQGTWNTPAVSALGRLNQIASSRLVGVA